MKEQTNSQKEALEPERSGGGKASLPQISPEVPAIPKKRRFTKEYKLKILKELEDCKIPGGRVLDSNNNPVIGTELRLSWRYWGERGLQDLKMLADPL